MTYLAFPLLSKSIHCSTDCAALPVCAFIYCLEVSGRQIGSAFWHCCPLKLELDMIWAPSLPAHPHTGLVSISATAPRYSQARNCSCN